MSKMILRRKRKKFVKVRYEDMQFLTACLDVFQAIANVKTQYKTDANKAYEMLHGGNYEIITE